MADRRKVKIGSTRRRDVADEPSLMEQSTQDRRLTGGPQVTVRARLEELAGNPDNPREDMGDLSELAASLQARGQLQPVTVISKAAFVTLKPEHSEAFGDGVRFVVLYGNRRLAAASIAGLEVLKIDVASSPDTASAIRASALVENIHRKNLEPLEEAREVKALAEELGSGAEAARQLGLSKGWVSQRLALLNLTPELKEKLRQGELKVKEARSLGTLSPEEQEGAWQKGVYRVNGTKAAGKATPPSPQPVPPQQAESRQGAEEPEGVNPVYPSSNEAEAQSGPVPPRGEDTEAPVQLMLDLEWEPQVTASEIVTGYGPEAARKVAEAILAQL